MIARHIFDSDHDVFRDAVRKFLMDEAYEQHTEWEKNKGRLTATFGTRRESRACCARVFPKSTAVSARTSATTW